MGARTFRELRAWQSARLFKLGIYTLLRSAPLADDSRLRSQLCDAAASAPSHIAEGFGRFDPLDNARFVRMAMGSLFECQNHLQDALDRGHISEEVLQIHDAAATRALKDAGAYLAYLQSPAAKRNADRLRRERAGRPPIQNRSGGTDEPRTGN